MKRNRNNTQNNFISPGMDSEYENLANIIYGKNPVWEYLSRLNAEENELEQTVPSDDKRWRISKIFMANDMANDAKLKAIKHMAVKLGIIVQDCSKFKLERMIQSKDNHQGVVAQLTTINAVEFSDFFADLSKSNPRNQSANPASCVLVLDGIEDPRNLGAIIRTAEAVKALAVIVPKRRTATINAISIKASSGAMAYFPIIEVVNLVRSLKELKKLGYWITGLDASAQENLYEAKLAYPMVLVLGAEGSGISRLVKEECDFMIKIPMLGKTESLNVSVAASIILYEIYRQAYVN